MYAEVSMTSERQTEQILPNLCFGAVEICLWRRSRHSVYFTLTIWENERQNLFGQGDSVDNDNRGQLNQRHELLFLLFLFHKARPPLL